MEGDKEKVEQDFKQKMKGYFIPEVEKLLKKEEDHLESLRKQRRRCVDRNLLGPLATIDNYIKGSVQMIEHIKMRLKQYKEYVGLK